MAEDVLFEFLHMEIVNLMYDSSATNDEQVGPNDELIDFL